MKIFPLPFIAVLLLTACSAPKMPDVMMGKEASVTDTTRSGEILKNLPLPTDRIPVAVYEFQDQTGQLKASENTTDYSSAVTKGGLSVLTKAMIDAGNRKWFMVAERGGLNNILREREIIRVMRSEYQNPEQGEPAPLPPLVYAGMLIEGGIIFYDTNVVTGGAAASYFGIGGHTEYRRDIVTIYLRAISIATGEVLSSVTSSKTIFSYGAGVNVLRYLSYDKLLEAESGFTINEPSQLAVRQAIETALYSLIMEGNMAGLWEFADKAAGDQALSEYLTRRDGKKTNIITDNTVSVENDSAATPEAAPADSIPVATAAPATVSPPEPPAATKEETGDITLFPLSY